MKPKEFQKSEDIVKDFEEWRKAGFGSAQAFSAANWGLPVFIVGICLGIVIGLSFLWSLLK